MPNEIADITPRAAEADDRLLVRSGAAAPFGLEALSNITPAQLVAIRNEIIAARGSRSQLGLRISTISNFVSPNAGGFVSGQYYDNSFHGAGTGTIAYGLNRIELSPFYSSLTLPINQLGVAINTAGAGNGKVVIYEAGADGWPSVPVFETTSFSTGATGYAFATVDFTFQSGTIYWLGLRTTGSPVVRTCALGNAPNIGLQSVTASIYYAALRRTVTFADPPPNPWNFTNNDRVLAAGSPNTSFRFRAA